MLAAVRGWFLRRLGVPRGVGILFGPTARRQLYLAVAGSLIVAAAEMFAVAAVLPLMQLMTGAPTTTGVLGVISDLLRTTDRERLAAILATLIFVTFIGKAAFTMAFRWWMLGIVMRQEIDTASAMLQYYLFAPWSLHKSRHTGEMLRNMNDAVTQVYSLVVVGSLAALTEIMSILAILVTLLVVQPLPTLGLVAYFFVGAALFQRAVTPRFVRAGEDQLRANVGIYQSGLHALSGVRDIQLRGVQDHFLKRYREQKTLGASARRRLAFLGEAPKHLLEIMFIIGVALLTFLILRTQGASDTLPLVALFVAAGFRVLPSMSRLLGSLNSVRAGTRASDLVMEDLVAARAVVPSDNGPRVPTPLTAELRLDGVRFGYPDAEGAEVLKGIDLTVAAGTSLALVGGSGAGKSTLVDIMAGFHVPTAGRVLRDGEDIREHLSSWQASIGIVPQTVFLSDGPLRENIAYGVDVEDVDEAWLAEVIERARLGEVVAALPQGLDSLVGEAGDRLSGGQRQRIGIARALYARPTMLILDEATSALDNETERQLTETIAGLAGSVTIVIVAHRLSTVRHCDQLAFLEDGRVAALGTFDEVRSRNETFERLVQLGNLIGSEPVTDSEEEGEEAPERASLAGSPQAP